MLLVIKIGDIVASLYKNGWIVSAGETLSKKNSTQELIALLNKIMETDVMNYSPNIYYTKGKEIESAIDGSKMLYYLGMDKPVKETGMIY